LSNSVSKNTTTLTALVTSNNSRISEHLKTEF